MAPSRTSSRWDRQEDRLLHRQRRDRRVRPVRAGPDGLGREHCNATDGAWIGLSRGWTDVYGWTTPGNYVEFGSNDDGLYVVRSAFDTRDLVDETNESDNHAYALIEVSGSRVDVLERGYGKDPWDPRKEVVRPWWRD